jgi:hypothetical protein
MERTRILGLIGVGVEQQKDGASAPRQGAPVPIAPTAREKSKPSVKPVGLHSAAQKLLEALAQHASARWTWGQVGLLAGLKASGGHFNAGRQELRDAGFIAENGDLVEITESGLSAAGVVPSAPSTPDERLEMWCGKLPAPAPDMLRALSERSTWTSVDALAASR